jgi:acetyltransferase
MDIIQSAIKRGQRALSEHDSKKLLKTYGIPVTRESLVQSAAEAVSAAESIGYPVALKACSPELLHKSETGCIALNLKTDSELQQAYWWH